MDEGKEKCATEGREVLYSPAESLAHLAPWSQEEADIRLLLHSVSAVQKGCKNVTIRTVDTDVVLLVVASCSKTCSGVWSKFRCISVHDMVVTINPTKC